MDNDDRIAQAAGVTEVLRSPRQSLSTFGTSNVYYYLVTEPSYSDVVKTGAETVIREGRVIAQKPRIVTPYYLSRLEGFDTGARQYLDMLTRMHGPDAPGMLYTYRNEPKELSIVSGDLATVVARLNEEADRRGDPLTSIIKGHDQFWDVSLLKFIYELTRGSARHNMMQMGARGLLGMDHGIPMDARVTIEELFRQVAAGERDPGELKKELDRWDVFDEYEDRFFDLFKKRG